ncbi:Mss4-like protein [Trichophaea hybrida]|nr:Mss4-like protein [Trichophaea hybrida]
MSSPITGTCLCGLITFTIAAGVTPLKRMACYCRDCQKNAGGPYQTNAMFNTSEITITDPESHLKIYTITKGTMSGLPKEKGFCGNCGCTLFTKPGHHKGEMTVIKTGILDNGLVVLPRKDGDGGG